MRNVVEFNYKYLTDASLARQLSDFSLKEEKSLLAELAKAPESTIKSLAKSVVLVVDPKFSRNDLIRTEPKDLPGAVVKMNFCYLSLINVLANQDIRSAMMITKCGFEICDFVKKLTTEEIRAISNANYQMCICSINPKNLQKINKSEKVINPENSRQNFLQHLSLMTLLKSRV